MPEVSNTNVKRLTKYRSLKGFNMNRFENKMIVITTRQLAGWVGCIILYIYSHSNPSDLQA
jgi:hypothetical protein